MVSIPLKLQNFGEISVSYAVWSIELSLAHIFNGNLVQFMFKFKIPMAFTLYKLSLKLLSSVADPEFSKRRVPDLIFSIFFKLTNKQTKLFGS